MSKLRDVGSYYIETEESKLPKGLFTDPKVDSDGKALMAYIGRHLRGSSYRVSGLPTQKVIAEAHFGWKLTRLEGAVRGLKQRGWLATSRTGMPPNIDFAYLIRLPQMALINTPQASRPKPQMVEVYKPHMVEVTYNYSLCTSNPVVISNYDDEGRTDEVVVARLKNYGVTDGQIHTLRRLGRSLDVARIECEVAWIRAGKRSSEKVRAESALLYTALRDNLPPPADVAWEQARAQRLELEHDELARRRAEAATLRTPEAIAASRPAIEAAKARLRKGMA